MGVAWYRRGEWPELLKSAADREQLEDTYDEWLESCQRTLAEISAAGVHVEKIDVGIQELKQWCQTKG